MKVSISNPSIQQKAKNSKGFSLVEVIIAIGIVALLLTGFLGVFGSAQRTINKSLGVKEANMLKNSLETEMSTLRENEISAPTSYESAFHKAFSMIENSTAEANAILIYQYKAKLIDDDDKPNDGILPAFDGDDGIQGKTYITQVAVRIKGVNNDLIEKELANKSVVGNVYAVRLIQLIKNPDGDLILGTPGEIKSEAGSATNHNDYDKAVIAFQAEFFRLPSNAFGFVNSTSWDFNTMGNPVAVVNMAVRR